MRRAWVAIAACVVGGCAPAPQPESRAATSRAALLGAEVPVTAAERVPGDAEGLRSVPKVAAGSSGALAVWVDGRRSWISRPGYFFPNDIYASLIDPSGALIDPTGKALALGVRSGEPPGVAFNGTEYLVAFCDAQSRLLPLRLTPLGVPVATPTPLPAFCDNTDVDVSWTGTSWLVVMDQPRTAVRVASDGSLLDAVPLTLAASDGGYATVGGVASGPSVSLAVLNNNFGAAIVRVSSDGGVLDSPPRVLTDAGISSAITAVDGGFFVVWQTQSRAEGAFVDNNGVSSGVINLGSPTAGSTSTVTTDGAHAVAIWPYYSSSAYTLLGQRVAPGGALLDGSGRALWSGMFNPRAAPLAGGFVVVGSGPSWVLTSSPGLRYGRLAGDLSLIDASVRPLAVSANAQHQPAVAVAGGVALVAWQDFRGFGLQAPYAMVVGLDGTPLAAASTSLNLGLVDGCSAPVLATEDTHVVAVCHDFFGASQGLQVVGVTLQPALAVSPPAAISNKLLPTCNSCGAARQRPAVAVRPESGLFAWSENFPGPTVAAAVLPRDGGALQSMTLDLTAALINADLVAAPLGDGYLVVWADVGPAGQQGVRFARVSAAGAVLDSPARQLEPPTANQLAAPALASDGERALVAYTTFSAGTSYVVAQWVDSDAGSSATVLLSAPTEAAMTPAVAYDGTRFVAVYAGDPPVDGGLTLWARQSLDDGGFSPRVQVGEGSFPALAFGDGGQGLLVYERFSSEPWSTDAGVVPEHASRIYVRSLTTPLSFPPEDAGDDAGVDAGIDAGADAGLSSDAGMSTSDAGPSSSDGGTHAAVLAVGCGCGASGAGAWLLLAAASLLRATARAGSRGGRAVPTTRCCRRRARR